ncbi:unnamed protein product [Pleuronectes platessa]|uniref:FYVE-type domain-containing protein n=1 Tax=Pleuronectes platessa TaxID=8262 RepID=A0A9N7UUA9_PLEPL|nr:unnamed protein product [Pleuronectes platessa]
MKHRNLRCISVRELKGSKGPLFWRSMDSFFKAAVCDLDKLLDDFELNTEELDCKSVFLKPSAYPFSSLGSQCLSLEAPTVSPSLPDLNSLHYGSATSCPDRPSSHNCSTDDREVKGQPLTGVDLLSSVDRRPAISSAPPCPDRALKPVCDLVNDTSSAILIRANSHDAFSELDLVEKQMEEEETLLVDFDSPVVMDQQEGGVSQSVCCGVTMEERASAGKDELLSLDFHEQSGACSASLSLLDVILPAAVERCCESTDDSPSSRTIESADREDSECEDEASINQVVDNSSDHCEPEDSLPAFEASDKGEASLKSGASDSEPVGLSCLPIAVSICGALVQPNTTEESGQATEQCDEADVCESTEADFLSALQAEEDRPCSKEPVYRSQLITEGRLSPEGQHVPLEPAAVPLHADHTSSDRSEPSPVDPAEFGFEYLPESEQAELLVTDEELDAFLQAHTEAEQARSVSYCSSSGDCKQPESLSQPNGALDGRLLEEELRSCGRARQDELEGLASPESDRIICVSVEGSLNPGAPSQSQDSCRPCQEEPELSSGMRNSLTSNTFQSQQSSSPDQQSSYGGARPKQLHCQTVRPPPAGEEEEEEEEEEEGKQPSTFSKWPNAVEDEESSPISPNPTEEQSNISALSPIYATQEHQDYSVGYDELSEPLPYPGEPPTDGPRAANWKREELEELGCRQPPWVPDSEAPNCMNCYQRFTFTKRRHHCRACGKVYCAVCCNRKCKLRYLEKEARVCVICFDNIHKAQALERMMSPTGPSPNPNVPSEYCSTIPPLQQARAAGTLNSPPPTVMVPVSVLKQPNNDSCPREQKRVWFADGILPNGEVADTTKLSVTSRRSSQEFAGVTPDQTAPGPAGSEVGVSGSSSPEASRAVEVFRESPVCCQTMRMSSLLCSSPPARMTEEMFWLRKIPHPCQILHLLEEGGPRPLTFVLNANLLVNVKLVTYSSCQCWCFGSNGLQSLGQKELVFFAGVFARGKNSSKGPLHTLSHYLPRCPKREVFGGA